MRATQLAAIGAAAGLLCPLSTLVSDSEGLILIALAVLFLVGLTAQTLTGLHAWRAEKGCAAQVARSTVIFWTAASGAFAAGWAVVFAELLGRDAPTGDVVALSLAGLPILWLIAAVCGAVVAVVTTTARAVTSR